MVKNYFYNLMITLANILFPILSFPYVSRVLGPEGIGKVQFVFSFAQYFGLIATIGIPIYGMKEIARHKNDLEGRSQVFSELMVIYFVSCLSLSAIYFGIIYLFPYFTADKSMYIAASTLVLFGFSYIEWLYNGMEEFKAIALRAVLFKFIGLGLLYLFVRQSSDYKLYLGIIIFTFLGNNFLSFFLLRGKVKFVSSGLQLRRHIAPLLLILGTTLAASMYTDMDTVLLGFLSDDKTVGLYTAAVKLSKITLPFVTSMGVILMPKIAKDFADQNLTEVGATITRTFRFLAFFAIPVAVGLALLAPEFIALFSGKAFLPATSSMQVLSLLPVIVGFGHLFLFIVLVPAGKNREMLLCVLGGLVTSLIFNILLIPHLKELGSSIANICSELVVTSLYIYCIKKYYSFHFEWNLIFKAVISALIFIPVVWVARYLSVPLVYTLLLSVSTCAVLYISLQLFVFRNNFVYEIVDFVKTKLVKAGN